MSPATTTAPEDASGAVVVVWNIDVLPDDGVTGQAVSSPPRASAMLVESPARCAEPMWRTRTMGVASVRFHSPALGKSTTYRVIMPAEGDGPFPVLMQLHGLSDDDAAWIQRSNLVRHAAAYPLLVGGRSGYLNWRSPERLGKQGYETLLMTDLPAHLARHFRVRAGPWAIGGLSMGGYGAMRLGLKHPDRFASIWAHSAAFHLPELAGEGFLVDPADADVYAHATRAARGAAPPVVGFDCGVDDDLIGHNRAFRAHLEEIGLAHRYVEHAGGHDWDYWDAHVPEALHQHARVLVISAARPCK